ncbi:wHTH domain-containing protein [Nocardia sp. NPDC003963]
MGDIGDRSRWFAELQDLETAALRGHSRSRERARKHIPKQTASDWFNRRVPDDFDDIWPMIETYLAWSSRSVDRAHWTKLHSAARQTADRPDDNTGRYAREWANLVTHHQIWSHIPADHWTEDLKVRTAELARALATLYARAETTIDDPWRDERYLHRYTLAVECLASWTQGENTEQLSHGEAVLLVLTPLLHQVQRGRATARLAASILPAESPSDSSTHRHNDFEGFLLDYQWLVRRARQAALPDRRSARHEIDWWLLHRWIAERKPIEFNEIRELLFELPKLQSDLAEILEPERLTALIGCLSLDIDRLTSEGGMRLKPHSYLGLAGPRGTQPLRERMVGLLLVTARTLALDITQLSQVVVDHLGIPQPVDLDELRATLCHARWKLAGSGRKPGGCQLDADCDHPAALHAVRSHVGTIDTRLKAIHRFLVDSADPSLDLLRGLPSYASAIKVTPAVDPDGQAKFQDWNARFTVDERRIQELLMGNQLYGSPDLAIREMYQNALDACRYRRAREEYCARQTGQRSTFEGEIRIEQRIDGDGRMYIDCHDNGVGMGEPEIMGAFSRAGTSFTGMSEYVEERAEWARVGLQMFPNSRFGIGVLSYFMLADEIQVTTSRLPRSGGLAGQWLEVTIVGPGHLFRIKQIDPPYAGPGTRVRLYLRSDARTMSAVTALRRLLGIAEFRTAAIHEDGDQSDEQVWLPNQLNAGEHGSRVSDGVSAHGGLFHCTPQPTGQVVWCERGGGLLVDGINVGTAQHTGVLASIEGSIVPAGAIVNLTGDGQIQLSVDRTMIVQDVAERVADLLTQAARELVENPPAFLNHPWIYSISAISPRVADILTDAAADARSALAIGNRKLNTLITGSWPPDVDLLNLTVRNWWEIKRTVGYEPKTIHGRVPDHIFLWRALAHRTGSAWRLLSTAFPGLSTAPTTMPGRPSDALIITERENPRWSSLASLTQPGRYLRISQVSGLELARIAERAVALRVLDAASAQRIVDTAPSAAHSEVLRQDIELLKLKRGTRGGWLPIAEPVSLGHLLNAIKELGIDLAHAAERLARYGYHLSTPSSLPSRIDEQDEILLEPVATSYASYSSDDIPASPGRMVKSSLDTGLTIPSVIDRLQKYGVTAPTDIPDDAGPGDLILLSRFLDGNPPWLTVADPIQPGFVSAAAREMSIASAEVVARLRDYGFQLAAGTVVDAITAYDAELLSEGDDTRGPWLDVREAVPPGHILSVAQNLNITPSEVADRLAEYGYRIGPPIPGDWASADLEILADSVEGGWLRIEDPISLGILSEFAEKDRLPSLIRVGTRLNEYGFEVPRHGRFDDLDERIILIHDDFDSEELNFGSWFYDTNRGAVTVREVLLISHRVGRSIPAVVDRLTAYGLRVPEGVDLGEEVDRDDLVMLGQGPDRYIGHVRLDESEPVCLAHLCDIANRLGRSLESVVRRMSELGIDIPSLDDLVLSALELVPWVSAPGDLPALLQRDNAAKTA